MPTEDDVYKAICEAHAGFIIDGPAKRLADLWQRKAAQKIMILFAPKVRERVPFQFDEMPRTANEDGY